MSKKSHVLENLALPDLCTYSIVTSPRNLSSGNEGFKTMDLILALKQNRLLSESLLIKSEKQVANNALVRSVKFKNIKNDFQFLSFNTGLLFVSLLAYYELNTPIIS